MNGEVTPPVWSASAVDRPEDSVVDTPAEGLDDDGDRPEDLFFVANDPREPAVGAGSPVLAYQPLALGDVSHRAPTITNRTTAQTIKTAGTTSSGESH